MTWNTILFVLSLSLFINVLFVWYLRQLLGRFSYMCVNIYDLKAMVDLYMKHLEVVFELEMFHGDPHIAQLMKHTADLVEQLEAYEEFYELISTNDIANIPNETEIQGIEINEQTKNNKEATERENKAPPNEKKVKQVLHEGP